MANITEILGTDSVSSSRPVINTNFELLNDELASVVAMLNPTTGVLQGLTNTTTQRLNVVDGQTLFSVGQTGAQVDVSATFSKSVKMNAAVLKSGKAGSLAEPTTDLAPALLSYATYFVDGDFTLPAGEDGQEVTIINASADAISVLESTNTDSIVGATSVALGGLGANVTLRCFETKWYVIGGFNHTAQ